MDQKHFKNGVLVKEIRDGIEFSENLGKGPLEISRNPAVVHLRTTKTILPQPIPRKDWPLWTKALAMIAKPEDKGVGDIVARTIGAENSEAFKKWFKATTGKDCGCTGRQRRWNIEYPL